jgi:hypothetical protein
VKRLAAGAAIALALVLSACGANDHRGLGDAGVKHSDDTKVEVFNFPNDYPNISEKCDGHGFRLFTTTSRSWRVFRDPTCNGRPHG